MQRLEFTLEEVEVLREVLQQKINEIEVEVHRTDTHDFKDMLRHRREVLERIYERLCAVPITV